MLEADNLLMEALLVYCECAYCKHIMVNNREAVEAHSMVCSSHPCRTLEKQLQAAREHGASLLKKLDDLGIWGEELARIAYGVPEGGFLTRTTLDDLTRQVTELAAKAGR